MCFFKDKWPKGEMTEEYAWAVQGIKTLHQIVEFIKPFKRKEDVKDYWQSPSETYKRKTYDCEDMAIMVMDILTRILKVEEVWFIIYAGYYMKKGKRTYGAHAVILFRNETNQYTAGLIYEDGYYEFTNKTLRPAFKEGQNDLIKYGYKHYPEGLKAYERRDHKGKIIQRKRAWIGYL